MRTMKGEFDDMRQGLDAPHAAAPGVVSPTVTTTVSYGAADAERARMLAENTKLRAFAKDIMRAWPMGDVDGGLLQSLAEKHGLIREKNPRPTEPCGDGCTCAECYGDMSCGVECYERTELLDG